MVRVLKDGNVIMYADDTTLYVTGSSIQEVEYKLQLEFNSICKWISDNRLYLNTEKTKVMVLGSKQKLHIYRNYCFHITYNGAEISQCSSIKCLGVIIDRHLLWHDQVDSVCKKIFAGLAMLKRIRPLVENDTLKLLYMCLIESQMNYCCEIWGDRFQIHVDRITKLQKRAARLILRCNIYTPSKEMFSNLDWTAFRYRIIYFRYIFVYKCIHGLAPEYYSNYFQNLRKI